MKDFFKTLLEALFYRHPPNLKNDEQCLDCEAVIDAGDYCGHGGDPLESYYDGGFHCCGERKPNVVKIN